MKSHLHVVFSWDPQCFSAKGCRDVFTGCRVGPASLRTKGTYGKTLAKAPQKKQKTNKDPKILVTSPNQMEINVSVKKKNSRNTQGQKISIKFIANQHTSFKKIQKSTDCYSTYYLKIHKINNKSACLIIRKSILNHKSTGKKIKYNKQSQPFPPTHLGV